VEHGENKDVEGTCSCVVDREVGNGIPCEEVVGNTDDNASGTEVGDALENE
jgi:hypothetical protein